VANQLIDSKPSVPDLPPSGDDNTLDWSFARSPFWLFSHLFALAVVTVFVFLGLWQLDRLDERRASNAIVESRIATVEPIAEALAAADRDGPDALDYQRVEGPVRVLEADLGRVVNRSVDGIAGEHVVGIVELTDGRLLAINRGFVPVGYDQPLDQVPTEFIEASGWLRATVERETFGAADLGEGRLLPRFDTDQVGARLGQDLPSVWLQLAPDSELAASGATQVPTALDLPPLDDGPHFGYAMQWFIFAILGVLFYGALVLRRARGHRSTVTVDG
jgi:cytochrome oxidase assembly protein ShyY1